MGLGWDRLGGDGIRYRSDGVGYLFFCACVYLSGLIKGLVGGRDNLYTNLGGRDDFEKIQLGPFPSQNMTFPPRVENPFWERGEIGHTHMFFI